MPSLLTLNYITPLPSFLIAEFKHVSVCWENYLRFYSFDIYFNVSTVGRQKQCRELCYFSYLTHSVRCNLSQPLITQTIHSRNSKKFVQMRPPNFWDTKISRRLSWIHYLGSLSILENHTIKDLYKALYKKSMITMKCNRIISYYAKSAMREKKEWNRMSFCKTQELSETFNFD